METDHALTRHETMAVFINLSGIKPEIALRPMHDLMPRISGPMSMPEPLQQALQKSPVHYIWQQIQSFDQWQTSQWRGLALYAPPHYSLDPIREAWQAQDMDWPVFFLQHQSETSAMAHLFREHDIDDILQVEPLSPFIDINIIWDMYQSYTRYLSEYAFSENVPEGFAGKWIHRSILMHFPEKDLPTQFSLHQVVKKNINTFDIDVHYQKPDIRILRCTGALAHPLDQAITENVIIDLQAIPTYQQFCDCIAHKPELLRVQPTYMELEYNTECSLNCQFCPRHDHDFSRPAMSAELLRSILGQIPDMIPFAVAIGGMGEPLQHPDFLNLTQMIYAHPQVEKIFLETNGLGLDESMIQSLLPWRDKLHIIINLNAMTQEAYNDIHGLPEDDSETFLRLLNNLALLSQLDTQAQDKKSNQNELEQQKEKPLKEWVTIQILKIRPTEHIIDAFFKHWQDKGFSVLLQKQNTYLGQVKDFRFSDLSPLNRFPCWHLKRDLVIRSDGTVPFCKQDLFGHKLLGRFAENNGGVPQTHAHEIWRGIWEQAGPFAAQQANADYSAFPGCGSCDEWYTFNY